MAGVEEFKFKGYEFEETPPPRGRRLTWLEIMLWAVPLAIVFLTVLWAVIWATLQTRTRGPEFRVQSAIMSQLNATQSQLTATWDLSVVVTNPNPGEGHDLCVERLVAYIFYGDKERMMMLAVKPVGLQPRVLLSSKRNEAKASFRLQAVEMYVGQNVSKEILQGLSAPGSASGSLVKFGLKLKAWYKGIGNKSGFSPLFCDRVVDFGVSQIDYLNGGTGISTIKEGQPRECYFYAAKDYYY